MVKDHRTNVEAGNAQGVLDGDLDEFVRAELLRRAGDGPRPQLGVLFLQRAQRGAGAPRPPRARPAAARRGRPAGAPPRPRPRRRPRRGRRRGRRARPASSLPRCSTSRARGRPRARSRAGAASGARPAAAAGPSWRTRSGSSSLITTWSKRGRSCCLTPLNDSGARADLSTVRPMADEARPPAPPSARPPRGPKPGRPARRPRAAEAADAAVEPAPLPRDPGRAVRPQLAARRDLRARRGAHPGALQPDLPRAGAEGNVKEISSTRRHRAGRVQEGGQVQGRQREELRDRDPDLRQRRRARRSCSPSRTSSINAEPPDSRSLLQTILFSFGPTILLVGAVRVPDPPRGRAAAAAAGCSASSAARAPSGSSPRPRRVTFEDVAGIDEAEEQLVEVVDFLQATPTSTSSSARASRAACCWPARPAPARRCSRARSPARPACRSSRRRRRSSSRRSWASAPRACATCSSRPRRPPRRSSSSTSSTRSAAPAAAAAACCGGHDEREQTLNQILTEMDGFDPAVGVIVLGATNRPGRARPGAAAAGPLRPPRVRAAARQRGPRARSCACTPARCRSPTTSTSTQIAADHAGHGRRRPGQPGQRGGAAGRAPRPRQGAAPPTSPTRSRRSCWAPSARSC